LRPKQYFVYALDALLLGSTWVVLRVLVQYVPPFRATAIDWTIGAVLLLGWACARRLPFPRHAKSWRAIVRFGLLVVGLPFVMTAWAEQYITASLVAILYSSFPLIIAALSPLLTHKRPRSASVFWIVVGIVGVGLLFWGGIPGEHNAQLGTAVAMIGLVIGAVGVLQLSQHPEHMSSPMSIGLQVGVAALLGLPLSAAFEHQPSHWTWQAQLALLCLCVPGTLAFLLYYWLLREIGAVRLGTLDLVVPVVSFSEGALLLHERVTWGMCAIIAGVLFASAMVLRLEQPQTAVAGESDALAEQAGSTKRF
jgi:probable blue pigment (indigoidine) exporter